MPQIITKIQAQKKNKNRVNIFINHQYAFSINKKTDAYLIVGNELCCAEIEQLKQTDDINNAYQRSIFYLKFRRRSRLEIVRYLKQKLFLPEVISKTVKKLESNGYINDYEFSRQWIEGRLQNRPMGQFGLAWELKQKGIDEDIIEKTVSVVNEDKVAWRAIKPKLKFWESLKEKEFKRKVFNYLKQRGFKYHICKEVYESAWETICSSGLVD